MDKGRRGKTGRGSKKGGKNENVMGINRQVRNKRKFVALGDELGRKGERTERV